MKIGQHILNIGGVIKKLSARYAWVRFIELKFHWIKIFVSVSFDLIEGHLECEKHAVMPGCLCKTLWREEGATHLQNGETWNQSGYQVVL